MPPLTIFYRFIAVCLPFGHPALPFRRDVERSGWGGHRRKITLERPFWPENSPREARFDPGRRPLSAHDRFFPFRPDVQRSDSAPIGASSHRAPRPARPRHVRASIDGREWAGGVALAAPAPMGPLANSWQCRLGRRRLMAFLGEWMTMTHAGRAAASGLCRTSSVMTTRLYLPEGL